MPAQPVVADDLLLGLVMGETHNTLPRGNLEYNFGAVAATFKTAQASAAVLQVGRQIHRVL